MILSHIFYEGKLEDIQDLSVMALEAYQVVFSWIS
jgi:hypothetical protein